MLFSDQFKITKTDKDDWFDPLLDFDTKLFIDPFLIFQTSHPAFKDSHKKVVQFFNEIFKLIAASQGNKNSAHYKKALQALVFPEVYELCLGYASNDTHGSGSAHSFAKSIAEAIQDSISRGMKDIRHFEELSIFNLGIGADRISDMTGNLLKEELIKYTQDVVARHTIPTSEMNVRNGSFNFEYAVWNHPKVKLPINQDAKQGKSPLLLIPAEFLRPLPTINPEDFYKFLQVNDNEILRTNLSYELKKRINKEEIIRIARENPQAVAKYIDRTEKQKGVPYDTKKDPLKLHTWYKIGLGVAKDNPLRLDASNKEEFLKAVADICENFRHWVSMQKGYEVLWNDTFSKGRSEEVAQRVFLGIALAHCKANDINVAPEEKMGRGAVDFQFSHGYKNRMLVETKLVRNGKFWNGLEKQLPEYLKAEQLKEGIFVAIAYTDEEIKKCRLLEERVNKLNSDLGYSIDVMLVDARPKLVSASKL